MNSQDYMDMAVLIAAAVARTKSMVLLDRLAYALNPESIRDGRRRRAQGDPV